MPLIDTNHAQILRDQIDALTPPELAQRLHQSLAAVLGETSTQATEAAMMATSVDNAELFRAQLLRVTEIDRELTLTTDGDKRGALRAELDGLLAPWRQADPEPVADGE